MASEKLMNILSSLKLSSEKLELLTQANVLASALNALELYEVSKRVELKPVFDCLQTNNVNELEIAVEVLSKFLSCIPPEELVTTYSEELSKGLRHKEPTIREAVLKQLVRCSKEGASIRSILSNEKILSEAARLIGDEQLSIAQYSISLLTSVGMTKEGMTKEGIHAIFSNPCKSILEERMNMDDTVRYRVYEVMINISCASLEGFQSVVNSQYMTSILNELNKDDVLLMLNSVELLTQLASTDHGLKYLVQAGVLTQLQKMLIKSASDPLYTFVAPGLLKFFGNLGYHKPQMILDDYPEVIQMLLSSLKDNELAGVAIDTIGIIGVHAEGKEVLRKLDIEMKSCMKIFGEEIKTGQTDMRIRSMAAVGNLLTVKKEEESLDLENLTESWYRMLDDNPTDMFVSISKQPFRDLRCSAFSVISVVASHLWGIKELASYPGFVEFIVDRSTEMDKEGKEAKFAVVQTLVHSPFVTDIFNIEAVTKFREYYHQGPFYVQAEAVVAFEGAT